jgi:membrane protein DedA with SNARE-associated domain
MDDKSKNNVNAYLRFSALAIQMGVTITAGALFGQWLDEKQANQTPVWTLVFVLFTVFGSLYLVIKEVIRLGKKDD